MKNRHNGSDIDDFLANENLLEHTIAMAKIRILSQESHSEQSQKSYLKRTESDRQKPHKANVDIL